MPTDVIMPALGLAQETGKLLRWYRSNGDAVAKGEPLFEVETDKVTVDVEAPADGTLAGLTAAEGEDVPVGRAVAVVLAAGEQLAEARPVSAPVAPTAEVQANGAATPTAHPPSTPLGGGERGRRRLASPKARRIAKERGVDIAALDGSGPNGTVVAADVERARGASGTTLSPGGVVGSPIAVGSAWRVMAERTTQSWQTVPHVFMRREVEATRLQSWRATARSRPGNEKVSHTDLVVKLVAEALRRHPRVNASWRDGAIAANEHVNVAIAVAIDDGVLVPVVHDADRLELGAIAARRIEVVAAAREGRLRPADLSGGTFTVSNLGMYGIDSFDAIVNAPQAAILSVGRIAHRLVPLEGSAAVRPMLTLGLSFDHRVVDGARGAEFLSTLALLVEEPAGLVR
ncbi:MAG: dihydrolipoamide acetyltransferase family protein [Gaiellaceae bacterium]